MSKEALHNTYLELLKAAHAHKPQRDHRVALVIGSNSGDMFKDDVLPNIGQAIAGELRQSAYVVHEPLAHELDVVLPGQMSGYLAGLHDIPDTLILSNGYTHMDWIEHYDAEEMYNVLHNNLGGSMVATSEFVASTINDPWRKHIVYIGSMAAKGVLNASAPYCAAKAGLNHFVKCMGWELTPKGYSVFIINPSNTAGTPMTEKTIQLIMHYRGLERDEAEAYWASINLMPRWLGPDDIAGVAKFLVSGHAAYASGTAIDLSGGQR